MNSEIFSRFSGVWEVFQKNDPEQQTLEGVLLTINDRGFTILDIHKDAEFVTTAENESYFLTATWIDEVGNEEFSIFVIQNGIEGMSFSFGAALHSARRREGYSKGFSRHGCSSN